MTVNCIGGAQSNAKIHKVLVALVLLTVSFSVARGQAPPPASTARTARYAEPLTDVLGRGFVKNWFVCGPFPSDLPDGIIRAAVEGRAALGNRDFMEPLGGAALTRPIPLLAVDSSETVWQTGSMDGPQLDLSSLFRGRETGIAYAAFYVTADAETPVFLESHTPFGARWWINGQPYRDIRAVPLAEGGVDRFLAVLPPGQHLVMFEAPLADVDSLSRALDLSVPALLNGPWANRTMLTGVHGWETALRLRRAAVSGTVYFDALPRDTGLLSGMREDARRLFLLAAWNHSTMFSPAGTIDIQNGALTARVELPALPAYEVTDIPLPVPIPADGLGPGNATVTVTAQVAGGDPAVILLSLPETPWPRNPVTWLGIGPLTPARNAAELEQRVSLFTDLALLQGRWRGGGFYAANPDDLLPFFAARPDLLDLALPEGRAKFVSVAAADSVPDPRVARPETLRRDVAATLNIAQAMLGSTPESAAFVEGPPPDAAGYEQLAGLGIRGAVTADGFQFMPGVGAVPLDPEGWFVLRRGTAVLPPEHGDMLLDTLQQGRRADNRAGWGPALELIDIGGGIPRWLESLLPRLPATFPSVRVDRLGMDAYFAAMSTLLVADHAFPPDGIAVGMHFGNRPGLSTRYPAMHRAWTETESLLTAAETAITLCGLTGVASPAEDLDWGWRILSARGAWWRLAGIGTPEDLQDSFGDLCAVREMIRSRVDEALSTLGRQVNTMGVAPKFGRMDGLRAILVFNPGSVARTAVGTIEADITGIERPALVEALDEPMPFTLDIRETAAPDGTPRRLGLFRFLARHVPAGGYTVCFLRSGGMPDTPIQDNRPALENDRVFLEFDPATGDLRRYMDKATGWTFEAGEIGAIFALNNEAARTANGAELWTSGPAVRPGKPVFMARRLPWLQELTIDQPFLDGRLIRRWRVVEGDSWPQCVIEFAQINARGKAVLMSAPAPDLGCVPVAGGSGRPVIGRRHAVPNLYRTRGDERPTGTYFLLASGWFAASSHDTLRSADGALWPLQPVLIVAGPDIRLRRAARSLATALYRRGIPAMIVSDTVEREMWLDPGAPPCPHLKYHTDAPMRIVLGGPESNQHAGALTKVLSADRRREVAAAVRRGEAVMLPDPTVHPGNGPVTTLLLGGTPQEIEDRLNRALQDYAESGSLTFDRVSEFGVDPVPPAEQALVFAWPGTLPSGMDPDGRMVMVLWTPPAQDEAMPSAPVVREFWLRAGKGDWKTLAVPEEVSRLRTPLFAAYTEIQAGPMPYRQSLLTLSGPGIVLETVKTAEYAVAARRAVIPSPRDGILLRLCEPYGTAWSGSASWYTPLAAAALTDGLERRTTDLPISEDSRIPCAVPPFGAVNFWVLPRMVLPAPVTVPEDNESVPRVFCRYWRQGMITPSSRGLPLAVSLQGTLTAPACEVTLTVANYQTDQGIESVAHLSTSPGWRAEPTQVYVNLDPGRHRQWRLRLTAEELPDGTGGVMAWLYWNGVRWVDTLAEKALRPEVRINREPDRMQVSVRNPWSFPACGHVELQYPGFGAPEWLLELPIRAPVVLNGKEERNVWLALPPEGLAASVRVTLNDAEPQHIEVPGS